MPYFSNLPSMYLSSTSNIDKRYEDCFGFIQHSMQGGLLSDLLEGKGYPKAGLYRYWLNRGFSWCLDNDVFAGNFRLEHWLNKLEALMEYRNTCLFIVTPDVIGDSNATLKQFKRYAGTLRILGYPVALVTQDGLTIDKVPWEEVDTLFIGGTDKHKLSSEAGKLILEGKRRGKWVHVGRVNSISRMFKFWMADSWDGTHLSFCPSASTKFGAAVKQIRLMKSNLTLFGMEGSKWLE